MVSKAVKEKSFPDFKLPPNLTVEQQIVMCVGQLVAEWAICETTIRGLFVTMTGGTSVATRDYAEVVWLSTSNTKGRCDLLTRCTHASPIPDTFKTAIAETLKHFKGVTTTRNYFCHASYEVNPDTLDLIAVEGHQLTLNDDVVSFDRRSADIAMVHSLLTAIVNCGDISREAIGLVLALKEHLGAQFPELPALPDGYPIFPAFHPQHTGSGRGKPR